MYKLLTVNILLEFWKYYRHSATNLCDVTVSERSLITKSFDMQPYFLIAQIICF
jgi:hypothetical protein